MSRPSQAYEELGYSSPSERAARAALPVSHEKRPTDRSAGERALRNMRALLAPRKPAISSDLQARIDQARLDFEAKLLEQMDREYREILRLAKMWNAGAKPRDLPRITVLFGEVEVEL